MRSAALRAAAFERRDGIYRFLSRRGRMRRRRSAAVPRGPRSGTAIARPRPSTTGCCRWSRPSDPRAAEWRIRRESYAHLQQRALPGVWQGPIRVLDLGAGNGWLSHRLASLGHQRRRRRSAGRRGRMGWARAGTTRCRSRPCRPISTRCRSTPAQFDLVVSRTARCTTRPIRRATLARGAGGCWRRAARWSVMDSPMFARERDGAGDGRRAARRVRADYGLADVVRPGVGFLTFDVSSAAATVLGAARPVRSVARAARLAAAPAACRGCGSAARRRRSACGWPDDRALQPALDDARASSRCRCR